MKKKGKKSKCNPAIFVPVTVGSICLAVVAGVLLTANPESTAATGFQEKLELGDKYLEKGEYEKAKVAFQDALEIDEKSPEAAIALADTYNKLEQPQQALEMLELTNDNLENMSDGDVSADPKRWAEKLQIYQSTYDDTKELLEKQGDRESVDAINDYIANFEIIVNHVNIYVTATPVPEEKSKKKKKAAVPVSEKAENPETEEKSESPEEPETTKEPEITKEPESIADPEPTENPKEQEETEQMPAVSPTEVPADNPNEGVDQMISPTPVLEEDTELPALEEDVPDDSGDNTEEVPAPENTSNTDNIPNMDSIPEETIPDSTEMPGTEETTQEQEIPGSVPETNMEQGEMSSEELLDDYIQEVLPSKPKASVETPIAYTYGDDSSLAAADGLIAAEKRDFNGDGQSELLVVSMQSGTLALDIYRASTQDVSQTEETIYVGEGFGKAMEAFTYGGTQECFLRDNGSSIDIGVACYYFGRTGDDGNPEARTEVYVYRMDETGKLIPMGGAEAVNGSQNNENDGFMPNMDIMKLYGAWTSENANALAAMDLTNNPMQDMAGIPNPLDGGLEGKEDGVTDLVTVNAGMQPGSGSLSISITDKSTYGK